MVRVAKPGRGLCKRVEYRLQIKRGATDYLEHVGGGGLLLERFAQLVEQARVLDGDDGLRGEIREQRDLLVGEETNFLAKDVDDSNRRVVLEHRHNEGGSNATKLDSVNRWRVALGIRLACREI